MDSVTDTCLKSVSQLAQKQLALENDIVDLEAKLKDLKKQHTQVSQVDLPEAMAETGLSEFTLKSGHEVSTKAFYACNIPKDRYSEAMAWFRENGHGDLIKNTVTVDFSRGEDVDASTFKQSIVNQGLSFADKTGIHPQTLRAFVREQCESGQDLPLDLLGVYVGQKTTIKEI